MPNTKPPKTQPLFLKEFRDKTQNITIDITAAKGAARLKEINRASMLLTNATKPRTCTVFCRDSKPKISTTGSNGPRYIHM